MKLNNRCGKTLLAGCAAFLAMTCFSLNSALGQGTSGGTGLGGSGSSGFGNIGSGGGGGGSSGGSSGGTSGGLGGSSGGLGGTSSMGGGGTAGGARAGGTNGGTLSSTNPLASYYGSPTASGALTQYPFSTYDYFKAPNGAFGQPSYGTTATGGTGTTGARTGTTGAAGRTTGTGMTGGRAGVSGSSASVPFYTSFGTLRANTYGTVLGGDLTVPPPLTSSPALQAVVDRSSRLSPQDRIRVLSNGSTIYLRGNVRNEHDRFLAEGILRLTPGVRQIVNQLQVGG